MTISLNERGGSATIEPFIDLGDLHFGTFCKHSFQGIGKLVFAFGANTSSYIIIYCLNHLFDRFKIVQTNDCEIGWRMLRFFDQVNYLIFFDLNDTESLRIVDLFDRYYI